MGYRGLRFFEGQHYLANAKLSSGQKFENPEAGFICRCFEDLYLAVCFLFIDPFYLIAHQETSLSSLASISIKPDQGLFCFTAKIVLAIFSLFTGQYFAGDHRQFPIQHQHSLPHDFLISTE